MISVLIRLFKQTNPPFPAVSVLNSSPWPPLNLLYKQNILSAAETINTALPLTRGAVEWTFGLVDLKLHWHPPRPIEEKVLTFTKVSACL